jgi:hypothetical protein
MGETLTRKEVLLSESLGNENVKRELNVEKNRIK